MTRVVVTGAGGFIGSALVKTLLQSSSWASSLECLVAVDLHVPSESADARLLPIEGSVADPAVLEKVCALRPDIVIHLASVPGGTAEKNYALGRRVNLDATADWLQALGEHEIHARFVYASSIAVYGENLPPAVDEQTPALPSLSYGVHKRACELLVADATRRGWVDGCALRLPGIVARPASSQGLMSAFMSDVFWVLAQGQSITLPVSPEGTAWWLSLKAAVNNLLLASLVDLPPSHVGRVYQMPALCLQMQEVVAALVHRLGTDRRDLVQYQPDPVIQKLFAAYPPLHTPTAHKLGLQHDGDVASLVQSVFAR
ncbi:NAD-dependent epimerase/dehydratase family protein [Curvibacter sp. CHRR-16]|uniref:NAD-dependent epimerase/dehydratase family protein n=1 Tax=Curvibacter sp. CHRR-16 TaxID=2835872 RepID=UPI001BD9CD55|nr:NAD-dependent epimerase/dehydratase family protein [Curvibacter sp. CHRR-16]MBT0569733.1 NAD-dependent epimerase/dehydratase family protein [Curvibacter sp. CHRR-16]